MGKTVEERLDRIEERLGFEWKEEAPEPAPVFKVGDRVKCVDPSGCRDLKLGGFYTVAKVLEDGKAIDTVEPGAQGYAYAKRFELAPPAEEQKEPAPVTFNVGDRVKCVDACGSSFTHVGDTGVVTGVECSSGELGFVHVLLDRSGKTSVTYPCRFELQPPAPPAPLKPARKFQPGDRVRCVSLNPGADLEVGKIYTIKGYDEGANNWVEGPLVSVEEPEVNGSSLESRFELVVEESKKLAPTFKVGDRVKCIDWEGGHGGKVGEFYTVEKVESHRGFDPENGDIVRCEGLGGGYARRFELAPKLAPVFKVGDRIRVIDACGGHRQKVGTVGTVDHVEDGVSDASDGDLIRCKEWACDAYARRFELVERPPEKKPEPSTSADSEVHPSVRVLGWPNVDGSFNLVLEPVDAQGHPTGGDYIYYTLPKNGFESGIINLARWQGLKLKRD